MTQPPEGPTPGSTGGGDSRLRSSRSPEAAKTDAHSADKPSAARKSAIEEIVNPMLAALKREMTGELIKRMRRRQSNVPRLPPPGAMRGRRRKRKAAMALSASVMGFSTGAVSNDAAPNVITIPASKPGVNYRANAVQLQVSEDMKEALAEEEGVRLTVYRDVAGYPTVGVGHLVRPADKLRVGDRISYDKAIDLLEADLAAAEHSVRRLVGALPLFQHEFDALVDLVYNVGEANVSQSESPALNRAIASGDYTRIADELRYHHAAGKKARGLVFRSERRQAIFLDAAYEDPRSDAGENPSRT